MDSFLTEIKNAHLFAEYLMCSGVKLGSSRLPGEGGLDFQEKVF